MDTEKTGNIIRKFRTQMNLTQKELAELINVSDKAVSKWECGNGCPDVSLLSEIAHVFGIDVETLLSGEINRNESEESNMKKMKFYVCKECGNVITSLSDAGITCCGKKLSALEPVKAEKENMLKVEDTGGELFISSDHEMTKEHYISFAAFINESTVIIRRLYPEWNFQFTVPLYRSGRILWYCRKCGFFYQDIRMR